MKFEEDYYPKEFMMTIQVLKMRLEPDLLS